MSDQWRPKAASCEWDQREVLQERIEVPWMKHRHPEDTPTGADNEFEFGFVHF